MGKILIAGGTGFVGNALVKYLVECGYKIHLLSRRAIQQKEENIFYFKWNIEEGFIEDKAFEGITTIINLTGANIGEKKWTAKRKIELIESRTKSIDLLYNFVKDHNLKIETFISSSAVGYYGAVTTEEIFTEESENGNDFLASICKKWENAALQFEKLGVRTVILRKGVIFGKDGGMYKKLAPLAKYGINVSLGSGKQYLAWIDLRDVVRLYSYILKHQEVHGVFNVVASEHITMNYFSKIFLKSFYKKSILPNPPSFIIKLIFGELATMLLEGSRVNNKKLKSTGFQLQFDTLENAFKST
ncbi:MAG TPA: TIGR01777 family oxidoreductase [Edaphocola sp.]|nr:TIGR01777 family oxidoreductase [Edaphocola sp.]